MWFPLALFGVSHPSWLLLRRPEQPSSLFVQGTEVPFCPITFPTSRQSWSRELWAISCCLIQMLATLCVVAGNIQEQWLVYLIVLVDLGWPDQCDLIILSRRKQLQQGAELINAGSFTKRTHNLVCLTFTTFGLPEHSNHSDCVGTCDNHVTYSHLLWTMHRGSVHIYDLHSLWFTRSSQAINTYLHWVNTPGPLVMVC